MTRRFPLFATSLLLAASCSRNDSGAAPPAAVEELEPTSQTVFGSDLLLFLEHPHLVRGVEAKFLVHLSVTATGEPVRSGRVALEIGASRLVAEVPARDGIFLPEGSFPDAGTFAARLVVESPEASETMVLGEIVVHADPESARAAAATAGEEPADALPFLMEQQWTAKLLLAEARPAKLVRRSSVPAQVVTPEGRESAVSSPAAGRLLPGPSGALPRSGERVEAGQVLALVEPLLGASDLAQLRALKMEIDLKALEVVRAASEADARLRFAERERERIAKLREKGLSTQQELEQAERDLALAQTEVESARATKASLEPLLEEEDVLRLPLLAPLGGTLVAASRVEGESVLAGDEVFRIVDPSRVWIVGRISEFDFAALGPSPDAVATFAALPGKRIEVRAPYLGASVDPGSRTIPIRYETGNDGAIRAGMLAELSIALDSVDAAVAIPQAAVVRDQGSPTAYVMLDGERFQKRALELGIEDAGLVEVKKGVRPGERVATRGANVVRLAALSPTSFGEGHHH